MSDRNYWVLCDDNCKFPAMTKEQILTAIEQACGGGVVNVDAGFVTTIKEMNKGTGVRFWVGTSAEYNALTDKPENCFCILTDEPTYTDVVKACDELSAECKRLAQMVAEYMTTDDGEHLYRVFDGEKEWYNPPLAIGTEYRTVERWQGKPVYTMLVKGYCEIGGTILLAADLKESVSLIRQESSCVWSEQPMIGDVEVGQQVTTACIPQKVSAVVDPFSGVFCGEIKVETSGKITSAYGYMQIWYTYA